MLQEHNEGASAHWPERKQRLIQSFQDQIAAANAKGSARLNERLQKAIERHSGSDPMWLQQYVSNVLRGYSERPPSWPYAAFEAAVLMATRCPATGRLLPVRP